MRAHDIFRDMSRMPMKRLVTRKEFFGQPVEESPVEACDTFHDYLVRNAKVSKASNVLGHPLSQINLCRNCCVACTPYASKDEFLPRSPFGSSRWLTICSPWLTVVICGDYRGVDRGGHRGGCRGGHR